MEDNHLVWKVFKWKIQYKNNRKDSFNMPHLFNKVTEKFVANEPSEENVKSFLQNFSPYAHSEFVSAEVEYVIEITNIHF